MTCLPADSALIVITDRMAFESATNGLTTTTFEGIVPANSSQGFPDPAGLTAGRVTFRTFGTVPPGSGFVSVYGAELAQQTVRLNTGTGAILTWTPADQVGTAYLDVVLPIGITAFATDLWTEQPFVSTVQATINSGEATENFRISTTNRPNPSFLGVISDTNTVLLVRFSIPAGQVGLILDNVSIGSANRGTTPVPEPGTMILVCAGLASLTMFKFRRSDRS